MNLKKMYLYKALYERKLISIKKWLQSNNYKKVSVLWSLFIQVCMLCKKLAVINFLIYTNRGITMEECSMGNYSPSFGRRGQLNPSKSAHVEFLNSMFLLPVKKLQIGQLSFFSYFKCILQLPPDFQTTLGLKIISIKLCCFFPNNFALNIIPLTHCGLRLAHQHTHNRVRERKGKKLSPSPSSLDSI